MLSKLSVTVSQLDSISPSARLRSLGASSLREGCERVSPLFLPVIAIPYSSPSFAAQPFPLRITSTSSPRHHARCRTHLDMIEVGWR